MKTSVRSILFTALLAVLATISMSAQTGNARFEQWYRAKAGRPSPTEQARLDAQSVTSASAHAKPLAAAVSANSAFEQWYRAKIGRPSPAEEARLNSPRANLAPAGTAQPAVAISVVGFDQMDRANNFRLSPAGNARLEQPSTASDLSSSQVKALIATAKSPAEHRRIAMYYESQTQRYLALSKEHAAMLASFKSNPVLSNNKHQASTIDHCAYLAQKFDTLAAMSNELALSHERMANEATKM